MKKILVFTIIVFAAISVAQAQHKDTHNHPRNEVGLSVGAAYEIEHKEWKSAIHGHFFRTFTAHSRWAWGVGAEYIPGSETHFEVGAGMRFEPIGGLQLSLMPGVSVTDKARFSLHTEAIYEAIHIGKFHLGPVVGYAWTKDHSHLSAGVHAAFAF